MSAHTITEKILAAHSGNKTVHPGENIWVDCDVLMTHDVCGPGTAQVFHEKFGADAKVWDKDKIVIIPDHYVFTKDPKARENIATVRNFAKAQGIKNFDVGEGFDGSESSLAASYRGVCHATLAEEGYCRPGEVMFGTDSHTCTAGAFGEFSTGIGDADAALVCGIGKLWLKVPATMKFIFNDPLPDYITGKDLILQVIGDIGFGGATYRAMEFAGDGIHGLNVEEKMSICNMAIEAGAKNGIIEPTQDVLDYVKARTKKAFTIFKSDPDAEYHSVKTYDSNKMVPCVAQPHSPDKYATAEALKGTKLDRSYIGSCTGGKIADLRHAARVLYNRKVTIETFIVPATVNVQRLMKTEQLNGKTLEQIFIDAGCTIIEPGCQACLGGPRDTKGRTHGNEQVISTTNRNFIGRMGSKTAGIYLASPLTAAASAIAGSITDPRVFI